MCFKIVSLYGHSGNYSRGLQKSYLMVDSPWQGCNGWGLPALSWGSLLLTDRESWMPGMLCLGLSFVLGQDGHWVSGSSSVRAAAHLLQSQP